MKIVIYLIAMLPVFLTFNNSVTNAVIEKLEKDNINPKLIEENLIHGNWQLEYMISSPIQRGLITGQPYGPKLYLEINTNSMRFKGFDGYCEYFGSFKILEKENIEFRSTLEFAINRLNDNLELLKQTETYKLADDGMLEFYNNKGEMILWFSREE